MESAARGEASAEPLDARHRAARVRWGGSALLVVVASVILVAHARSYDFFCDDAFIAVRYAQQLAAHGAPVYNLGERVEGYTSPLWMALIAAGFLLHAAPVACTHALGAASGVLLVLALWRLWHRVEPAAPWTGAALLLAVAITAPVAAWTLGGLETPLFTNRKSVV